jgi:hypothetical protein
MLRWISLAVVAIVLTAAGTLAVLYEPAAPPGPTAAAPRQDPIAGPPPKLELVGAPVYNFGILPRRTEGAHSWEIKNVGRGPLEIWLDGSTCSCTVAKLRSEPAGEGEAKKTVVVQPGQATPIEVSWNTKEWQEFAHAAYLGTNDPASPSLTLTVRGKVLPWVAVLPAQSVTFSPFSNEESRRADLSVISPDRADLKLTKLVTSKPGLIVAHSTPMTPEEAQQHKARAGYHVTVEIKPGMPAGGFHEELIIRTDHPNEPEVRVPVVGKVSGPITAIPERLRLPNVSSRAGASEDLILLVRGGRETRFEVAYKPEKVQVAIKPDPTSTAKGRYRLTITVPAGIPPGPVLDRVILKTDYPQATELIIPVNIFISRSGAG